MPRAARIVVPGLPHHVTQRGNRRQKLFYSDADGRAYLAFIAEASRATSTRCLAWCLMDNHVHLILRPETADGLRGTLAKAHTRYAQRVNRHQELDGYLFQGRYASQPMDDAHLVRAIRYVENNPVTAGLVAQAEEWRWSSARAHIFGADDGLTDGEGCVSISNWRAYLADGVEAGNRADRREAELRGQSLGAFANR